MYKHARGFWPSEGKSRPKLPKKPGKPSRRMKAVMEEEKRRQARLEARRQASRASRRQRVKDAGLQGGLNNPRKGKG